MKTVRFEDNVPDNEKAPKTRHEEKAELAEESESISSSQSEKSSKSSELMQLRPSKINLNVGFPSSYATQLMKITAKSEYEQEQKHIAQSWEAIRRSRVWRESMMLRSKAARVTPLLPLPNFVRSLLHELQLVFLMCQLINIIWLATKLDWRGRLRGPLDKLPGYVMHRMPWLPGQQEMHNRVMGLVALIICAYFPSALIHFAFVLDDLPDETDLQLVRKAQQKRQKKQQSLRKSRRWSWDPRFDQFRRPRRRQWATVLHLTILMTVMVFGIIILASDFNYYTQYGRWTETLTQWLRELQRNYYISWTSGATQPRWDMDPVDTLDTIHVTFQCCGSKGGREAYKEWWQSDVVKPDRGKSSVRNVTQSRYTEEHNIGGDWKRLVPFSCCQLRPNASCDHTEGKSPDHFYQRGCAAPIIELTIVPWMKMVGGTLALLLVLMIPQLILYLSIIQPREVIRQFLRTRAELHLFLAYWGQVVRETKREARKLSLQLEKMQKQRERIAALERKLHEPREPGDEPTELAYTKETTAGGLRTDGEEEKQEPQRGDTMPRRSVVLFMRDSLHPPIRRSTETQLDLEDTTISGSRSTSMGRSSLPSGQTESTAPTVESTESTTTTTLASKKPRSSPTSSSESTGGQSTVESVQPAPPSTPSQQRKKTLGSGQPKPPIWRY
ncbi:hypothetical protein CSKR_204057 [Clonorchis sinensis]|uniref:Uncharacterized protein n=1 Tax=Clonorchis sinensis TaxID=79923 RepID=A0A8T1M129_CLOSI|nr:hypothetical protein CSKR_204057 [Clonorchis sinensis]